MATRKKATKKAARAAKSGKRPEAAASEVKKSLGAAGGGKPARKRRTQFTEKQLRRLLHKMLFQFADQVDRDDNSYSNAEGFKLMQMMESLGLIKPSDVKVEWVEKKES